MKLLHLINPVNVPKNHELFHAQPITFKSIQNALAYSKNSNFQVEIASTQFQEDHAIIPDFINKLSDLNRSVNDVNQKLKGRKLPLLNDILVKSKEVEGVDYIIFTNIDIGLQPYFYNYIYQEIEKGYDAIVVNKRRLSSKYKNISEMDSIYADLGHSHPGFDCFIFRASMIDQFRMENICVGVPFSGVTLLHNIVSYSKNPSFVLDQCLTFHIGTNVLKFKKSDYYFHNRAEFFKKVQPHLKSNYQLKKFPYSKEKIVTRALKWALNPSMFSRNYLHLSIKSSISDLKNIRWNFLQR